MPLFMGSGDRSSAACWKLVSELVWLLIEMGGLQQPIHAEGEDHGAWMRECQKRDQMKWDDRAESFLYDVGKALGYHVRLEREDQQ